MEELAVSLIIICRCSQKEHDGAAKDSCLIYYYYCFAMPVTSFKSSRSSGRIKLSL